MSKVEFFISHPPPSPLRKDPLTGKSLAPPEVFPFSVNGHFPFQLPKAPESALIPFLPHTPHHIHQEILLALPKAYPESTGSYHVHAGCLVQHHHPQEDTDALMGSLILLSPIPRPFLSQQPKPPQILPTTRLTGANPPYAQPL